MDFEQIRAFLNVASLKSFSGAGEKMFISQPSVSVRIKSLEEELGVILFDRYKAREPSLTEAGRIFYDFAQTMINLQDECREKLTGLREEATGLVYIGASTVPGTYLLPELLSSFNKEAAAIDFNINILDTSAVLEGVCNYSYDLGFVGLSRSDERLEYIPLLMDELVLCTAKGLLKERKASEEFPLEAFFNHHLIMREKGSATRQILEKKLSESGIDLGKFKGITYINSLEGIKQAVRQGLGIAVCSRLSLADMITAGTIDTFQIEGLELKRFLYMVYHRSRVLGAAAEKMKSFAANYFTK